MLKETGKERAESRFTAAGGPPWGRLVEDLECAAGTRAVGNVLTLAGILRREFSGYS